MMSWLLCALLLMLLCVQLGQARFGSSRSKSKANNAVTSVKGSPLDFCYNLITNSISELADELKFRKLSLSQYRDTINNAVGKYIDTFRSDQNQLLIDAQSDFKAYTKAFNQLYEDMSATLLRQQEAVKALEYKRPRLMDESLENFMQFYNESMSPFLATHSKHVSDASTVSKKYLLRRKMIKKNERIVQSFYSRFVGSQLRDNWDSMRMSAQETVQNAEDSVRVALDDYHKLQEELALNAKQITIKSQEIITNTLDKRLVRKETELLKSNLKNLENVGSQWLDEQMLKLDQALKVLQDRIQATSSLYEDLIVKRQASYYVTSQNDYTLNKILKLIDPAKQTQQGWKLLKEESGYKVWIRIFHKTE